MKAPTTTPVSWESQTECPECHEPMRVLSAPPGTGPVKCGECAWKRPAPVIGKRCLKCKIDVDPSNWVRLDGGWLLCLKCWFESEPKKKKGA
jgi:hypothetical protein